MAAVLEICAGLPQKQFAAGECLLSEGKTAGLFYVLIEGAVEICKGDLQVTTVSEEGSIFGEVSVLLGIPHMATVKTLQPSTFYVVDEPDAFLQSHPELAFQLAKVLAKRLHLVTTYLVDLKRQFAGHDDHFALVDEVLENLVHHQGTASEPGSDRHPDTTVE